MTMPLRGRDAIPASLWTNLSLTSSCTSGTNGTMSPAQKRPRLDDHVVRELETIRRPDQSFEKLVNHLLWQATGTHMIESDPLEPQKFMVRWQEDQEHPGDGIIAAGLSKRRAQNLMDALRGASIAYSTLYDSMYACEDEGDNESYEEAMWLAEATFDFIERVGRRASGLTVTEDWPPESADDDG
jgi:hypothetical protein